MQKIIIFMCLCVMLLLVGTASARTVWAPQSNPVPILPPDAGNWNDPNNWDNGIPTAVEFGDPGDPDNQTGKAVFFGTGKAECQVTTADAVCYYFVLADNEPMDAPLVIKNGGTLTTGNNWSAIAYNQPGGHVIVEAGGSLICGQHLWVGSQDGSVGTLDINGGYVRVNEMIGLGWSGDLNTSTGYINVNEGLLSLHNFNNTRSIGGNNPLNDDSRLDIRYGKVVFDGNHSGKLTDELLDGRITGFGLIGNVNVELIEGNTTLTANDPMNPSPVDVTVPVGNVELSWTNMDPNIPPVYVDVWFGTDPDKLGSLYTKVISAPTTGENTTTVTVSAPLAGTYYWQVDSYIYGSPYDEPNLIEGHVYTFNATDDFPPTDVSAGVDMITWANEPVPLGGTYTDDGTSTVDITWTSSDPSAVFSPSNTVANPTVTVDNAAGAVTLTFTVQDQVNDAVSDDMIVTVYANKCQAARVGAGLAAQYPLDVVVDCVIDLRDFAALAAIWLEDYALGAPAPN